MVGTLGLAHEHEVRVRVDRDARGVEVVELVGVAVRIGLEVDFGGARGDGQVLGPHVHQEVPAGEGGFDVVGRRGHGGVRLAFLVGRLGSPEQAGGEGGEEDQGEDRTEHDTLKASGHQISRQWPSAEVRRRPHMQFIMY